MLKILERRYIEDLFKKKKPLYFPDLKNKNILSVAIEKHSPEWAKDSCLARYKIKFSGNEEKTVRATAHIDGSKKTAFDISDRLYKSGHPVPRALGYFADTRAFFYLETEGTPLLKKMRRFPPSVFKNIGEKLAKIHESEASSLPARQFEKKNYLDTLKRVEAILPRLKRKTQPLASMPFLEAAKRTNAFIHGDFYPSNIIIKKGSPVFLDFDKSGKGNFAADIASFLFFPETFGGSYTKGGKEAFLNAYCKARHFKALQLKKDIEALRAKIFFDALHAVSFDAYYGWEASSRKEKTNFLSRMEFLIAKIEKSYK